MTAARNRKAADHVTMGPGGRYQCMHCGDSYNPFAGAGGRGLSFATMIDVGKSFTKQHRACKPPQGPRCAACLELGHVIADHVRLKVLWPGCGDDGLSSTAIWSHMVGQHCARYDTPDDPDDFGRCSRLLAAPWAIGWRGRMLEMGRYGDAWARLAAHWDDLEALFAEEAPTGNAPRLYARMKQLQGEESDR